MNMRNESGMSPEELLIQDAFMEGQRAGNLNVAAGCNPFADVRSPEYQAWERGRFGAISVRMAGSVA